MSMALWNSVKKGLALLLCVNMLWGCTKKEVEPGELKISSTADILELIENKETFVVYLGSTTCGHCQDYAPIVEKACVEKGATIYKVMLDLSDGADNKAFIEEYGLEYTPTTYYFEEGKVKDSFVGVVTVDELMSFIKKNK